MLYHVTETTESVPYLPTLSLHDAVPIYAFVARSYADSAYNSERVRDATSITTEIVRKFADQTGFVVHPRRWIVERTFAWINRNRRLAKDFERTIKSATALLYAAAAIVLIRRIARYP